MARHIADRCLRSQRLAATSLTSVVDVVHWLDAVQVQE
jgi:hypothetical protein